MLAGSRMKGRELPLQALTSVPLAGFHGKSLKKSSHFSQLEPAVLCIHSHLPYTCNTNTGSQHTTHEQSTHDTPAAHEQSTHDTPAVDTPAVNTRHTSHNLSGRIQT